ncbi:MAG: DUF2071 domain-containing protein [Bacteroidota bacterium]
MKQVPDKVRTTSDCMRYEIVDLYEYEHSLYKAFRNTEAHRTPAIPPAAHALAAAPVVAKCALSALAIEPAIIRSLIPQHERLHLDTFDGSAWLSLVPFQVYNMHLRFLPSLPGIAHFHEMNLRTYVTDGRHPGTVFLHIHVNKLLPVLFHRAAGLPYHKSQITVTDNQIIYNGAGHEPQSTLRLEHRSGQYLTDKTELDRWLTERYCTYQQNGSGIYRFPIHHQEWPLRKADIDTLSIDYRWKNIHLGNNIAAAHYADGVDTLFWMKEHL